MPLSRSLPAAALVAVIAGGMAVAQPAEAQRQGGGGGGRPVAASPGAKPSMGGGHWNGNSGGGRWDGRSSGRGDGRWDGRWSGRGDGRWDGRWHGHRNYYYPRYAVGFGLGLGLGWPYWGWGYDYPYYGFYRYPYSYAAPVGIVEGPVYEPAPVVSDASSFRWYCPSSSAYYPEVRECSRAWMKVVPSERGPVSPPVTPEGLAPSQPPASGTPRSSAPVGEPYVASTYRMRTTLPRQRGTGHDTYALYATP